MKKRADILSNRPTSPHLSIYKPQISTTLSITHRATGGAMYFALIALSWLMILFQFDGLCECIKVDFNAFYVKLCLYALSYAGIYHFCNGIRHLFWDIGIGFSIKTVNFTGWLVVFASVAFTIALWSVIL